MNPNLTCISLLAFRKKTKEIYSLQIKVVLHSVLNGLNHEDLAIK